MAQKARTTEYQDNYQYGAGFQRPGAAIWEPPLNPKSIHFEALTMPPVPTAPGVNSGTISSIGMTRDPREFYSNQYDDIRRNVLLQRDPKRRTRYIDPFHNQLATPSGRRLTYDDTHPETIYGSQISSELGDNNNCYSFPTTTGLDRETPWCKDLQWRKDGEYGQWPTNSWKEWTRVALAPAYDGHDDQVEYSKYKGEAFSTVRKG